MEIADNRSLPLRSIYIDYYKLMEAFGEGELSEIICDNIISRLLEIQRSKDIAKDFDYDKFINDIKPVS